jgi:hypothetical protein
MQFGRQLWVHRLTEFQREDAHLCGGHFFHAFIERQTQFPHELPVIVRVAPLVNGLLSARVSDLNELTVYSSRYHKSIMKIDNNQECV